METNKGCAPTHHRVKLPAVLRDVASVLEAFLASQKGICGVHILNGRSFRIETTPLYNLFAFGAMGFTGYCDSSVRPERDIDITDLAARIETMM